MCPEKYAQIVNGNVQIYDKKTLKKIAQFVSEGESFFDVLTKGKSG